MMKVPSRLVDGKRSRNREENLGPGIRNFHKSIGEKNARKNSKRMRDWHGT